MQALPILHAAQRMSDAAALDLRVWALMLSVIAAVLTLGLLMAARLLRRPRARRRLTLFAASMLTLAAVVPSVLPYDHVLPALMTHSDDHAAVHASHCHDTPASCADAPVTAGPGQLFDADPLLLVPAMLMLALVVVAAPALRGISVAPDLRPPLVGACCR